VTPHPGPGRVLWDAEDGHLVALDPERGRWIALEGEEARLFEGLSLGRTPEELARERLGEFDAPLETLIRDIEAFREELRQEGWLR
jgi:hypothetical protein